MRIPGKLVKSPYLQEFDSGATGSVPRRYFQTKHPFASEIGLEVDVTLINSFTSWLKERLSKKRKKCPYLVATQELKPPLFLGIDLIKEKQWFYNLAYSGQQWSDLHVDVILYYLRKKGKYGSNRNVRFTTTDCCFKTKLDDIFFKMVAAKDENSNLNVKTTDDVASYIYGTRLIASVQWDLVDFVLCPVNLKKNHHWILIVFDIIQRSLNVYDSFPKRREDFEVNNVTEMFAIMLPLYLDITKFYEKRPELLSMEAYKNKKVTDPFHINKIRDHLPKQKEDSLDCDVYIAAFAEYASENRQIPYESFDVEYHRKRFGALLWDYAKKKQESGAVSDEEKTWKVYKRKGRQSNV